MCFEINKKNLNYILLIKKKEMKKITLLITIILAFTACKNTNTESANPSEADKATFARNIKAFENHHVKGFATEDLELLSSYFADTVKWSPPMWNDNKILGKGDLMKAAEQYFSEFDNLTFLAGDGGIDSNSAYWGGSFYSELGEQTSKPNGVRIYGTWTGIHTASGATINNKWYAVVSFNEDGKVVMFSDWMDVTGMQTQINAHVARQ